MFRRCGNGLRPEVLLAALWLGGCGSNPQQPAAPANEPVEAAPAEPAAAQTFPLEGGSSAPNTSVPATQPQAAKPAHTNAPTTPGAPATAEPPLPPEAVQQFDNAVAMVNSGNLAAAEQAFRALSTAYPTYSGPLVNLGILQLKAGKLSEAEQTLQAAIERRADNAAAYNQLGIVYRHQGKFSEAEQAYLRAVQIDPNYANAHLNLGVLCDLYLQQPQRALEAFERYLSVASAPDEKVSAWVKELKVRLESAQRASGAG
jgi:tetratricopeptide (TPR) repeat protein